ncbi:MAG TPA: hypothetical protein VFS20_21350 [Longimicrobium sp.]|nr:hypothetical protein [Longimicrobium sp.]
MTNTRCPDCGAPTSPGAVVCPQCGFPIRPDVMSQAGHRGGGGGSGSRTGVIVAVAVAVVLGGIVFIGIIAALAIPRFTMASARAKEKNGEALLKWAYVAEQTYYAQNGRYTSDLEALTDLVPPPSTGNEMYAVEVSAASDRDLCLEAVPTPAAGRDVNALSMDADGSIYRSAGCSGEPYVLVPSAPGGASGEEGARQMMREVHEGIVAYRMRHGTYPTDKGDMLTRVHDTQASHDYNLVLTRAEADGVCMGAVAKSGVEGPRLLSVDHDGKLYDNPTCTGTVLETFTATAGDGGPSSAEPAADSAEPASKPENKDMPPIERMP